jgi:tetratricopeptide (TPR) repeat protein
MATQTKTAAEWRRAVAAAGVLAAATLLAAANPASAQQRSNNDGRALDANTRVGSGRQNEPGGAGYNRQGPMVTGNQIVTGNVTAGRQFRGPVAYTDPNSFRGVTSGSFSDAFVRGSAGVPRPYGGGQADLTQPRAFYGSGLATPPPTGFVPTVGATGGYVATDSAAVQPNLSLSRSYTPTLDPSLRSRELILPSTGTSDQDSMLSASPLYGVRVWRPGGSPNDYASGAQQNLNVSDRPDRFGADRDVNRMRDELNRAGLGNTDEQGAGQGQNGPGATNEQGGATNAGGQPTGQGLQRPLNGAINAPGQQNAPANSIGNDSLRSAIGQGALQSSVATGQGIRSNLLIPADRQTPQLARLRQAFERQQGNTAVSDVEAARQFNRELQAVRQAQAQRGAQQGQPGQPGQPGAAPGGGAGGVPPAPRNANVPPPPEGSAAPEPGRPAAPDFSNAPSAQPQPAPAQPEKIGSIAEGVQAPGLRDVLKSAEDLMREQKFAEALQKYDTAQRVAPNNALITMGRANAELGASDYRRAEMSLRDAVSRAPELVVGQFDLRSLIGQDRLQVLVKDLKDLSASDPKSARAPMLLAYIAYNTGNEAQAGEYLATAEQRAGPNDSLLKAWRRFWKVGASPEATQPAPPPVDANK